MSFRCTKCGYKTNNQSLKSFGGKFCPKCGARLVEVLSEEKNQASKSLLDVQALIEQISALIDEPLRKHFWLKFSAVLIVIVTIQSLGFFTYQIWSQQGVEKGELLGYQKDLEKWYTQNLDDEEERWLWEAYNMQNNGELVQAEELYQKVLANEPNNARALSGLGFVANLKKDTAKAQEYYKKVLALEPSNTTANQSLGAIAKDSGDFASAQNYFEKVLTIEPENVTVLILQAEILRGESKFEEAIAQLMFVLRIDENNSKALLDLYEIYQAKGDQVKAEEVMNKLKTIIPVPTGDKK